MNNQLKKLKLIYEGLERMTKILEAPITAKEKGILISRENVSLQQIRTQTIN